jgi:hypothetical protein
MATPRTKINVTGVLPTQLAELSCSRKVRDRAHTRIHRYASPGQAATVIEGAVFSIPSLFLPARFLMANQSFEGTSLHFTAGLAGHQRMQYQFTM